MKQSISPPSPIAWSVLVALLFLTAQTFAADRVYQLAVPQSSGTNLLGHWDFNQTGVLPDFTCTFGAWRPATNAGPDGSSCMETCSNMTMIAMNVRAEALPLEITYRHSSKWTGKPGNIGTSWTWDNDNGAALVSGFSTHFIDPPPRGQTFGKWYTSRVLVTAEWIVVWDWGETPFPSNVLLMKRPPEGQLLWFIGGVQRVDDLTIRYAPHMKPTDLVKQCMEAVERIPADKRTGSHPLPGVKSAAGKAATVRFLLTRPSPKD